MVNPYKGESTFEVEGKTFTLKYGANAWAELEHKLGRGSIAISQDLMSWMQDPEKISIITFRALLWAGLRKYHKDVTIDGAGDLIDDAGGLASLVGPVTDAIAKAYPDAEPGETKGEGPTITNGTGSDSSSTSSVSGMPRNYSGNLLPES